MNRESSDWKEFIYDVETMRTEAVFLRDHLAVLTDRVEELVKSGEAAGVRIGLMILPEAARVVEAASRFVSDAERGTLRHRYGAGKGSTAEELLRSAVKCYEEKLFAMQAEDIPEESREAALFQERVQEEGLDKRILEIWKDCNRSEREKVCN
jgi:hypothetical protein